MKKILDIEVGLENCGGLEKVYYKSLKLYLDRYKTINDDLPAHTTSINNSHSYLHKMKGISSTLGCSQITGLLVDSLKFINQGTLLTQEQVINIIELSNKTNLEIEKFIDLT